MSAMLRGAGSPASGRLAMIQRSSAAACPRRKVSDGPPGGWAMRSAFMEKPVQNISGRMARRAPPAETSESIFAARRWFSGTSSQAMSIWMRATFTDPIPLPRPPSGGRRGFPHPNPLPPGEEAEAADRLAEGFFLLAEGEAGVGLAVTRVLVESAGRDRGHADFFDEIAAKSDVVVESERAEVGTDVISAGGRIDSKTEGRQLRDQVVAPAAIRGGEVPVIVRADRESRGGGVLERSSGREGDELMRGADGRGQRRRGGRPTDLPARQGESLSETGDRDRALSHPGKRSHRHVFAVVKDVLIHLVGDAENVALPAETGDELQLLAREDLAGGVVGRVEEDRPRFRRESPSDLLRVEAPAGRVER